MQLMSRNEEWIDKTMNSLSGMQPAQAPAYMRQRILDKVKLPLKQKLSLSVSWSLAAGLALLISINIWSVVHFKKEQKSMALNETSRVVASEYFNSIIN